MSRNDFRLIALTIKDCLGRIPDDADTARGGVYAVARALAHTLKLSNARFDDRRFLEACGIPVVE